MARPGRSGGIHLARFVSLFGLNDLSPFESLPAAIHSPHRTQGRLRLNAVDMTRYFARMLGSCDLRSLAEPLMGLHNTYLGMPAGVRSPPRGLSGWS